MSLKLNLIAAVCENMGIGKNNDLPWRLNGSITYGLTVLCGLPSIVCGLPRSTKTEMAYFTRMTSSTKDPNKKNVVIMGSRTWKSIPPKFKPLQDRINFVLSSSQLDVSDYDDVYVFNSLESAVEKLHNEEFIKKFENVWVIGGSHVYKASMDSAHFYRLYLTEIKKYYDCDTFMPPLKENLKLVSDPDVPDGIQKEKDVEYVYKIYENTDFKSHLLHNS